MKNKNITENLNYFVFKDYSVMRWFCGVLGISESLIEKTPFGYIVTTSDIYRTKGFEGILRSLITYFYEDLFVLGIYESEDLETCYEDFYERYKKEYSGIHLNSFLEKMCKILTFVKIDEKEYLVVCRRLRYRKLLRRLSIRVKGWQLNKNLKTRDFVNMKENIITFRKGEKGILCK